jgi:hypothetical protein
MVLDNLYDGVYMFQVVGGRPVQTGTFYIVLFIELFYGDWHGTYVPFSSVQSKLFVTVGLNH